MYLLFSTLVFLTMLTITSVTNEYQIELWVLLTATGASVPIIHQFGNQVAFDLATIFPAHGPLVRSNAPVYPEWYERPGQFLWNYTEGLIRDADLHFSIPASVPHSRRTAASTVNALLDLQEQNEAPRALHRRPEGLGEDMGFLEDADIVAETSSPPATPPRPPAPTPVGTTAAFTNTQFDLEAQYDAHRVMRRYHEELGEELDRALRLGTPLTGTDTVSETPSHSTTPRRPRRQHAPTLSGTTVESQDEARVCAVRRRHEEFAEEFDRALRQRRGSTPDFLKGADIVAETPSPSATPPRPHVPTPAGTTAASVTNLFGLEAPYEAHRAMRRRHEELAEDFGRSLRQRRGSPPGEPPQQQQQRHTANGQPVVRSWYQLLRELVYATATVTANVTAEAVRTGASSPNAVVSVPSTVVASMLDAAVQHDEEDNVAESVTDATTDVADAVQITSAAIRSLVTASASSVTMMRTTARVLMHRTRHVARAGLVSVATLAEQSVHTAAHSPDSVFRGPATVVEVIIDTVRNPMHTGEVQRVAPSAPTSAFVSARQVAEQKEETGSQLGEH